jgi:hypothetical protein
MATADAVAFCFAFENPREGQTCCLTVPTGWDAAVEPGSFTAPN